MADLAFASAWKRAVSEATSDADLKRVLHECIRRGLDDDLRQRLAAPPGKPVYVRDWDGELPPAHADLEAVEDAIDSVQEDLIDRDFTRVMDEVDDLIAKHGLPGEVRQRLALGVLEAKLHCLRVMRDRVQGRTTDSILPAAEPSALVPPVQQNEPASSPKPLASVLVEGFMENVALNGVRGQTRVQTEASVRLFIKAVGDRPMDTYAGANGHEVQAGGGLDPVAAVPASARRRGRRLAATCRLRAPGRGRLRRPPRRTRSSACAPRGKRRRTGPARRSGGPSPRLLDARSRAGRVTSACPGDSSFDR